MVAGRKSLGCKNSVAIQIKRAVPSDKVCAEKPKLLRSLTCCQRKRIFFHDTSSASGFKSFQDIGENKFLDSFAANLAPFLYKLKTDFISDYQNIVSAAILLTLCFIELSSLLLVISLVQGCLG
jgi:predicted ATPase